MDLRERWQPVNTTDAGRPAAAQLAAARAARCTQLSDAIPQDARETLLGSLDLLVEASGAQR